MIPINGTLLLILYRANLKRFIPKLSISLYELGNSTPFSPLLNTPSQSKNIACVFSSFFANLFAGVRNEPPNYSNISDMLLVSIKKFLSKL